MLLSTALLHHVDLHVVPAAGGGIYNVFPFSVFIPVERGTRNFFHRVRLCHSVAVYYMSGM